MADKRIQAHRLHRETMVNICSLSACASVSGDIYWVSSDYLREPMQTINHQKTAPLACGGRVR